MHQASFLIPYSYNLREQPTIQTKPNQANTVGPSHHHISSSKHPPSIMMKPFRKSKRLLNLLALSKHSISRVTSTQYTTDELDTVLKLPKKVIKALYDYSPQGPGELGFQKGDFFHVMDNDDQAEWYDATNPATNLRGMVPLLHFEVFGRTRGGPENGHNIEQGNPINAKLHHVAPRAALQTLYGVTLYEFKAERADELDVQPGENLVICAHHDYEWFIAKPITRLGGPGLVPALYVKIVDARRGSAPEDADVAAVIRHFNIPTVEQWKDQTARYQALTIPLGHILNAAPVASATLQYFAPQQQLSRSLLALLQLAVAEALVDLYHLDHGRYQYVVTARLTNGRTRVLHRYYQDFYDLQVRLLELFPYEAGKIENLRRIIPLIPGPLINVNDSISKLRREKLDFYLRNLVALPLHILRCEDVLALFEVTDNGVDREGDDAPRPVTQTLTSAADRRSQYLGVVRTLGLPLLELPQRPVLELLAPAVAPTLEKAKVKVKFYYEDDIFVLLLPGNLRLADLKTKLVRRLGLDEASGAVYLFLKNDYDEFMDAHAVASDVLTPQLREQLFDLEIDDDTKFQGVLYDKCKVVILSEGL